MNFDIAGIALFDIISWTFIVIGAFFTITGSLGLIRLPDVFSRMHGVGMVDTMGISMILGGLVFQADDWLVAAKLSLILAFIFFTSPTTTFALARAAIHGGVDAGPLHKKKQKNKIKKKDDKPSPT